MKTIIAPVDFDENGALEILSLSDDEQLPEIARQINTTIALDGTLVVEDRGYLIAGKDMSLSWIDDEDGSNYQYMKDLIKNHTNIYITGHFGNFLVVTKNFNKDKTKLTYNCIVVAEVAFGGE